MEGCVRYHKYRRVIINLRKPASQVSSPETGGLCSITKPEGPEFYTPSDVTIMAQVSLSAVYKNIRAGRRKAYKAGPKQYRIRPQDLEEWLAPYRPRVFPDRGTTSEEPQNQIELEAALLALDEAEEEWL
ncbi:MAG: helix-turn-helix domain-containing protein [Candidatus Nanopelagicales bacterium]